MTVTRNSNSRTGCSWWAHLAGRPGGRDGIAGGMRGADGGGDEPRLRRWWGVLMVGVVLCGVAAACSGGQEPTAPAAEPPAATPGADGGQPGAHGEPTAPAAEPSATGTAPTTAAAHVPSVAEVDSTAEVAPPSPGAGGGDAVVGVEPGGGDAVGVSGEVRSSPGEDGAGSVDPQVPGDEATRENPAGRFTAVEAGWEHTCVLRADGTMSCWGYDYEGKARTVEGEYVALSAGGDHTCGLGADAEVDCWGDYQHGALEKVRVSETTWDLLSSGPFTAVAAGGWHTCAVRADGSVICWGLSDIGAPGHPLDWDETVGGLCWSPTEHASMYCFRGADEDPDGRFSAMSAGGAHTCGLRADATVHCWGHGPAGSVQMPLEQRSQVAIDGSQPDRGIGSADEDLDRMPPDGKLRPIPERNILCHLRLAIRHKERPFVCAVYGDVGQAEAPAGRFSAVSAGGWHSCGVRVDAGVVCWGLNIAGQADAPDGRFTAVSAGWAHTCALRPDASVECWGDNTHGQADAPPGRFTSLAAGGIHTCGLRPDASVVCWGVPGPVKPPIGITWVT